MTAEMPRSLRISARALHKNFGAVRAVEDVTLDLIAGEVHGLIGENGSGKSTFVAMLAGIHQPSAGEILLNDVAFAPKGTSDAAGNGVAIITQESTLIDSLSVGLNLYLGREGDYSRVGLYNFAALFRDADAHLQRVLGTDAVSARAIVSNLTFEQKKNIEVARALLFEPNVMVFDETTNALSQRSRERLYGIITALKDAGAAIVFISHELSEVLHVSDRITILKDGHVVETLDAAATNADSLKRKMVGREIRADYFAQDSRKDHADRVVLDVANLASGQLFENVSFSVRAGEVLGIGGLAASGMSAVGEALFGIEPITAGTVKVRGEDITSRLSGPAGAVRVGLAYVPKDRDSRGLMLLSSIADNLVLPSIEAISGSRRLVRPTRLRAAATNTAESFSVKATSIDQFCIALSGGNRQKVALSKWLTRESVVLILDCPTRGVDVGVKAFIYGVIRDLAAQGVAILMITEELPELIAMSDRIIILRRGRIAAEVACESAPTEEDLIMVMVE